MVEGTRRYNEGEQEDRMRSVEDCRTMQVQTWWQLVRTYYRPPDESRQLQPSVPCTHAVVSSGSRRM